MSFHLERDNFDRLVFVGADGTATVGIAAVRAFALTAPDRGWALVSPAGHELAWIEHAADLPAQTRQLIEDELAQREFMPLIRRIIGVSSFATPSTWQLETDRGPASLWLKSEDDIRRLKSPGSLLIADGHGLHFMIRDRNDLDAASQKILKRFL